MNLEVSEDQLEIAELRAAVRVLTRRLGDAEVENGKLRELLQTYLRAVPFDSIRGAFVDPDMAEMYLEDLGLI